MLTLRPAEAADGSRLRAVAAAAYQGYVDRIGHAPAPMTADYDTVIRDSQVWVAQERDEVVGLLVLVARSDHLLLENIAVLPSAQGRGIGARLLVLAEDRPGSFGSARSGSIPTRR